MRKTFLETHEFTEWVREYLSDEGLSDLQRELQNDPETGVVMGGLKSGKYVFYMGVKMPTLTDGTANTVLGYAATTPTAGGLVVMADGSGQNMTAAEFAAAPKPPNAKLSQP